MYEDNELEIAVRALEKLQEHHDKFITALKRSNAEEEPEVGEISITDGAIIFTCLNHKVTLKHRSIAHGGRLKLIQYRFCVPHDDEDVAILTLYHQTNGELTKDVDGEEKVCGYNNTYVATFLMNEVGKGLLMSRFFAP